MKNLVYKELKISIPKFFYILPILLALLFFLKFWIFTIVFMYFFWISVTNIYASYNAQQDASFCSMLPVTKKDIVLSKIYAFFIVEGIHLFTGFLMMVVHNMIFGYENFFLDTNIAFIGIIIAMYSLFNVVFLPLYFKTAYYYGKPVIYAIVVTLIYAFIFEFGAIKIDFLRNIIEGNITSQLVVLGIGVLVTFVLNYVAITKSVSNFESIE